MRGAGKTRSWQYSIMGCADTNWNLLLKKNIGRDKIFEKGCGVAEIPWLPLPSTQAAKLEKDAFADFNIAVYKGGVWPFSFVGTGPKEYSLCWPQEDELVGRWVNINKKESPFLNNNIEVLVRRMQKTTLNVTVKGVDLVADSDHENERRLAVLFEIYKQNGTVCAEFLMVEEMNNMTWGNVYNKLSAWCHIKHQDMKWYDFVPLVSKARPLGNYSYDLDAHMGRFFPEISAFSTCKIEANLLPCYQHRSCERGKSAANFKAGRKRENPTNEERQEAAKAVKTQRRA